MSRTPSLESAKASPASKKTKNRPYDLLSLVDIDPRIQALDNKLTPEFLQLKYVRNSKKIVVDNVLRGCYKDWGQDLYTLCEILHNIANDLYDDNINYQNNLNNYEQDISKYDQLVQENANLRKHNETLEKEISELRKLNKVLTENSSTNEQVINNIVDSKIEDLRLEFEEKLKLYQLKPNLPKTPVRTLPYAQR